MSIKEVENENKFDIKKYKYTCDDIDEKIPDPLPKHFRWFMLLIGKPASGKTTFWLNLVCRYYKKKFHRIFVFSPSLKTLDKNPLDKLPDDQKYDELTYANLSEVLEKVKDSGERTLIVMDDVQNDIKNNGGKGENLETLMKKLIMNRRHIAGKGGSISIIITSQVYNIGIPLSIRKQADTIFFWSSKNQKEKDTLWEEVMSFIPRDKMEKIFRYVFNDLHDFLMIKLNDKPSEFLYKNWNRLKWEDDSSDDEK